MASPMFDNKREKFSADSYQGFDWSFQPNDQPAYSRQGMRKLQHSPSMTPPLGRAKHEDSHPWAPPIMTQHPPSHPIHRPDEPWQNNVWQPPSSERACLMDLAKENVLLKRQLHNASLQIHRLRGVLSGMDYNPRPHMSKEDEKKNPNQARFWKEDEHKRFVAAIKRFGPKDVKAISKAVRTRTPVQVRTHAQKYFLKIARDRRKQQVTGSDATTDGTDSSRENSTYPYGCSSSDMTEEIEEQAEAAVAAVAAASGEEGTSAAAAAAFVAASSDQVRGFGAAGLDDGDVALSSHINLDF